MRAFVSLTLSTLAVVGLAACQTVDTREDSAVTVTAEENASDAERRLPPVELVNLAIQSLQVGDNETARRRLNWALQQKPGLRTAERLLRQLDTDPVDYLGNEYFEYRIQPGDSLSVLAARFLKDSLKFVILARYNGIDDPGQLKVGQSLRIPGTPPTEDPPEQDTDTTVETKTAAAADNMEPGESLALSSGPEPGILLDPGTAPATDDPVAVETPLAAEAAPPPPKTTTTVMPGKDSDDVYLYAQKLYRTGWYTEAATLLERELEYSRGTSDLHTLLVRDLLVRVYEALGERLTNSGEMQAARAVLEKAVAIDPGNNKAIGQLKQVEDRIGKR